VALLGPAASALGGGSIAEGLKIAGRSSARVRFNG
jgi:hypothetical protein